MACSCSANKSGGVPVFTVVIPGGEPIAYSSDIAAQAKAKQVPGAYVVPSTQPA